MVVYKITNKINNKIYIGQTTHTIEYRLNKHWSEAKCQANGKRPNNFFHNALLKYGIENFIIEEVDSAETIEELNEKEIYWINYYNSTNKEIGYNLMPGGKSGIKSEETKQKISQKKKENWQNEELAARMRKGLVKATKEWQKKCEENRIEITCENCGKVFLVPPFEARTRRFCSNECANSINIKKATAAAAEKKKRKTKERYDAFSEEIEDWTRNNIELIKKCPANKISSTLNEIQQIAIKYGFSDWRIISKVICGSQSKKELLSYLKEKCENVC